MDAALHACAIPQTTISQYVKSAASPAPIPLVFVGDEEAERGNECEYDVDPLWKTHR